MDDGIAAPNELRNRLLLNQTPFFQANAAESHARVLNILVAEGRLIFCQDKFCQLREFVTTLVGVDAFRSFAGNLPSDIKHQVFAPFLTELAGIADQISNPAELQMLVSGGASVALGFTAIDPIESPSLTNDIEELMCRLQEIIDRKMEIERLLVNCTREPGVTELGNDGAREPCPICMEDFEPTSRLLVLPCNHILHVDCAVSWLLYNPTCPYDRLVVLSD